VLNSWAGYWSEIFWITLGTLSRSSSDPRTNSLLGEMNTLHEYVAPGKMFATIPQLSPGLSVPVHELACNAKDKPVESSIWAADIATGSKPELVIEQLAVTCFGDP
jgi:hypothetical protein